MNHPLPNINDIVRPQPSPKPGLEDPRSACPEPKEIVNDPESSVDQVDSGTQQSATCKGRKSTQSEPGIVDPRNDQIGPDL